jgi:hypothetical protein
MIVSPLEMTEIKSKRARTGFPEGLAPMIVRPPGRVRTVGEGPAGTEVTYTVTDAKALPNALAAVSSKVVVTTSGTEASIPLSAFSPAQPPEAVTVSALVEDQIRSVVPPMKIAVGVALSIIVGRGGGIIAVLGGVLHSHTSPLTLSSSRYESLNRPTGLSVPTTATVNGPHTRP